MSRLVVQIGPTTVVIKDDRAILDKATLKAWKKAVTEIVTDTFDLLVDAPAEEEVDG